jgi:hypothetical protein
MNADRMGVYVFVPTSVLMMWWLSCRYPAGK